MERAAESTFAKLVARLLTPILLAIIGWLLVDKVGTITQKQDEQGRDITQIKSDVRDVNTRFDAQILRQIEDHGETLESHEARLQQLERTVPVP